MKLRSLHETLEQGIEMKIYTRTGDCGETSLLGGTRVRKDDRRIAAYGDVDELNAAVGLAISAAPPPPIETVLRSIQHQLFSLGAELASPAPAAPRTGRIDESHIESFEAEIDAWEERLPALRDFIVPGGTPCSTALHVARCVCRRAERQLVTLMDADTTVGPLPLQYLNRLSDLLFVLARAANHEAGVTDIRWQKAAPGSSD